MKRIWTIISRVGTILFTIGFAFLILSALAKTTYNQYDFYEQTISSQQFQPLGARYNDYDKAYILYNYLGLMSTQDIYNITINSNVPLNVYIIDMNLTELAPNYKFLPEQLNQTILDNLLQTKSAMILWQGSVSNGSIIYTPLKDSNCTLLVSNPSNEIAQIQYKISYYQLFVPRVLGMQIGAVTIPVGLILAAPMLKSMINNTYKKFKMRINKK